MPVPYVMVEAKKQDTLIHPTGNYHFDPKGVPDARKRAVPADVAIALEERGIAEQLDEQVTLADIPGVRTVDQAAADRTMAMAERVGEFGKLYSGPLDTLATTHTQQDSLRKAAGPDGVVTLVDEDASSADTPELDADADGTGTASSSRTRRAARGRTAPSQPNPAFTGGKPADPADAEDAGDDTPPTE